MHMYFSVTLVLQVMGYPTLKLYSKGKFVAEFEDERSFQALSEFLTRHNKIKDEL